MSEILEIGAHRVKCGCITLGLSDLMRGEKADLVYSDPPWGQGNLNYWQTVNTRHTRADPRKLDYDRYLTAVFTGITENVKPGAPVLIEYGQKWASDLIARAASFGLKHAATVELLYRSGRDLLPCDLHVFGFGSVPVLPEGYVEAVRHPHGFNTLRHSMLPFATPGGIVLDPCCGMGYTAKAALLANMRFRGNELNRKRLDKTIARLRRSLGRQA